MIYKLRKTVQIDGATFSELNLDGLEELTGDDLKSASSTFKILYKNEMVASEYLDRRYQEIIVSRIVGINPQDLGKLKAPDYVGVCMAVQNFLLDVGSGETTTTKT